MFRNIIAEGVVWFALATIVIAPAPALAAGGGAGSGGATPQRAINSGLPPGEPGPPGAPNNRHPPHPSKPVGVRGSPRPEGSPGR